MEEYQSTESVVEASVDAGQGETSFESSEPSTSEVQASESGVNSEVAAPSTPKNNFGDALQKELARREAKMKEQYEAQVSAAQRHQQYLERQARIAGFRDVSEYMEALDQYEQQQQMEREASKMGLDLDTYQQYFAPVSQELEQLRSKVQSFEQQQQQKETTERNQSLWKSLYDTYPSLLESANAFTEGNNPEWYNDRMQSLVSKGYDPIDAYELAHKDTLFRQKEQEVLARVTGRDAKQILPSNDRPNNVQFDPANMSMDEILKLSERVQRGERITF